MSRIDFRRFFSANGTLIHRIAATTCAFLMASVNPVDAALVTFTTVAEFNSAIAGRPTTIVNFDSDPDGTTIAANSVYQQILFDATDSITGDLQILDGLNAIPPFPRYHTISSPNYLGTSIEGGISESLVFTFQTPVNAVGLYILSASQLFSGDVGLRTGGTLVSLNQGHEIALTGNNVETFAYFLGIVESDATSLITFPTFTLEMPSTIPIYVGIDSITYATAVAVPEPGSLLLLGATASAFGYLRRRRKSQAFIAS